MASAPVEARVRSILGSYRLLAELGRDPLGVRFLACPAGARSFPKWAVVRRMHTGVARDPAMVHAYLAATQAAMRMVHRNIATTFDFGGKMTLPWAAREHMLGVSMMDLVVRLSSQRTRMPWALAGYIVAEAAEGVAAVRARIPAYGPRMGFMAGAVAPSVFVTAAGEVKIVDGCLPLMDGNLLIDSEAMPYRPREPMETDQRGGRADAFGLGVLLWELVAGRRLFAGQNDDETGRLLEARVIPSLRTVAKAPPIVDEIVLRAAGRGTGHSPLLENAADVAAHLRAGLVAQGRRAGAEDVARMLGEVFAEALRDQEAVVRRAWADEQELQAAGDIGEDVVSETETTRPNSDTVPARKVHREPGDGAEPAGEHGFDDLATIPLGQKLPDPREPLWRKHPARPLLQVESPRIDYLPESPRPPPATARHVEPPSSEPAVIILPTPSRSFTLPPIDRSGLSPLPMPPPPPPPPRAAASLPRAVSAREKTRLVRRKTSSPYVVGGVAFALSFLAIAIFGVSRRASSDPTPVAISPRVPVSTPSPAPTTAASAPVRRPAEPWTTLPGPNARVPTAVPVASPDDLPRVTPGTHVPESRGAFSPPPPSGHVGLLTVFCTPACDEVFDGSRALGPSPVFKVSTSAGVHRLRLRVGSVEKRVSVTVTENDTAVVRENVGE